MTQVEITDGQGIIDIFCDGFASCLVVKKALAVNWPDCGGSIAEYYAISAHSVEERNYYTQSINESMIHGSDEEQMEIVKNFLGLFSNGNYKITKSLAECNQIEFMQSDGVYGRFEPMHRNDLARWFYPDWELQFGHNICTITNDKINPERVDFYCDLIKKGIRPSILTISVSSNITHSDNAFVLDGHHKIEAYLKLKENIPIINISKLDSRENETELLLRHAKSILSVSAYNHLFLYNYENISKINLLKSDELTSDLDSMMQNMKQHDSYYIEKTLKKHSNTYNPSEKEWLDSRLNKLGQQERDWFESRLYNPSPKKQPEIISGHIDGTTGDKIDKSSQINMIPDSKLKPLSRLKQWINKLFG
jgi:hypothetical protein